MILVYFMNYAVCFGDTRPMSLQTRHMSKQFLGTRCSRMHRAWSGQGSSSRRLQAALSGKKPWTAPCCLQSCHIGTDTNRVHQTSNWSEEHTEYSCLSICKKEHEPAGTGDVRRWPERLAEGGTAEGTWGWRCALGSRGSMPTGYIAEGL